MRPVALIFNRLQDFYCFTSQCSKVIVTLQLGRSKKCLHLSAARHHRILIERIVTLLFHSFQPDTI